MQHLKTHAIFIFTKYKLLYTIIEQSAVNTWTTNSLNWTHIHNMNTWCTIKQHVLLKCFLF